MQRSFQTILMEFLETQNLTPAEFSRKTGISRSQVTSWLKGKSTPRLQNLRRIALTFNISSNYFIGISEKPYPIKPNALK